MTANEKVEPTAEQVLAAERRADRVRALEDERRGYAARGLDARVRQVDEAIRLAKGEIKGRSSKKSAEV